MTSVMKAIAIVGVSIASISHPGAVGVPGPQDPGRPGEKPVPITPGRPRFVQLRPTFDTDVVLSAAELTIDAQGQPRLTLEGPLKVNALQRLFWVVNTKTLTYRVFELSGDSSTDAKRIEKFYRDSGVSTDLGKLEKYLDDEKRRSEGDVSQGRGQPAPAASRAPIASPAVVEGGVSGEDSPDERSGPRVTDAGMDLQSGTTTCDGNAFSKIETWEPARFWFDVAHVNETWTAAWWTGNPRPTRTSSGMSGGCWANPDTFFDTHWDQEACTPQHAPYTGGFDAVTTGVFKNSDFSFNFNAVRVFARAQVQHSNGSAHLSSSFYYQNLGATNFYEGWFLSGISSGYSVESCVYFPPPQAEIDCYNIGGTWDGSTCWYSPIIFDLNRDGFDLTSPEDGVMFDGDADGVLDRIAWTSRGSDDAWLALDRNRNGRIDDGSELFGNYTPINRAGETTANGFEALKTMDGSPSIPDTFDGIIDERDAVFARLLFWTDRNHNGISEPRELQRVADSGLLAVRTNYKTIGKKDRHGNLFRQRAKAIWPDRDVFIYDVWLRHQ